MIFLHRQSQVTRSKFLTTVMLVTLFLITLSANLELNPKFDEAIWRALHLFHLDISMTPFTTDMSLMDQFYYKKKFSLIAITTNQEISLPWKGLSLKKVKLPILMMNDFPDQKQLFISSICRALEGRLDTPIDGFVVKVDPPLKGIDELRSLNTKILCKKEVKP